MCVAGPSLELRCTTANLDDPYSWTASPAAGKEEEEEERRGRFEMLMCSEH